MGLDFFDKEGEIEEVEQGVNAKAEILNEKDFHSSVRSSVKGVAKSINKGDRVFIQESICKPEDGEFECEFLTESYKESKNKIKVLKNIGIGLEGVNILRMRVDEAKKEDGVLKL